MPDARAANLLTVKDLTVDFRTSNGWLTVVDGVSFDIRPGEIVGLVGESGSGKSVTSLALMRLLPPRASRIARGSVMLGDVDLTTLPERRLADLRGNEISMIFQEPMTSLNPAFTIGTQITETVRAHRSVSRAAALRRAIEVLELVGIPRPDRAVRSYPHELSGGMRQRAMIAMAIACEPKLLIADEPTTALDVTVQAQVLDVLRSMRAELGMAILFITHDLGVVAELCDRVAVMYSGQIVESAPVVDLFVSPNHPYSDGLLRSRPTLDGAGMTLRPRPGSPTAPGEITSGCRFAPRCVHATELCVRDDIDMRLTSDERAARCVRIGEWQMEPVP
ncbi:MAG TPA: ABC transporter ATP-binding protein [Acidimicrobiales bacterium]